MEISQDRWLSECFGWPVFNVRAGIEDDLAGLSEHAARQSRATYQAKVPALDVDLTARLERAGMSVVNLNLTLAREPGGEPTAVPAELEMREADPERDQGVRELAARAFRYSRFHLDPAIPDELAGGIKRDWVGNCLSGLRGERLLVAARDDEPVGFLAELRAGDVLVIDLIAVGPEAQGTGAGRALIERFQADAVGRAELLEVGTQAANIPATRFYERCGWVSARAAYDLHLHVRGR